MKTTLVSFFTCLLLLCSCIKEGPQHLRKPITPTRENIAGNYTLVGLSLIDDARTERDVFGGLTYCVQDNVYSLRLNGNFLYTDAGVLCDPATTENSTWTLQDFRHLRMGTTVYKIEQFNGLGMALSIDTTIDGRVCKLTKKFLRR